MDTNNLNKNTKQEPDERHQNIQQQGINSNTQLKEEEKKPKSKLHDLFGGNSNTSSNVIIFIY